MGSVGEADGFKPDYDVICIGAGMSGIYIMYRCRELGLKGIALETGAGEGGTWYWNRYPGARFDSESYSYQYFWDKEMMREWHWQEHFAGQPEILRYINRVVDKHDLRKYIKFNTWVSSAKFDPERRIWVLTDSNGNQYTCRWMVPCLGVLNNPTLPNIPGVKDFKGEAFHTYSWPKTPVYFENKRVAVIGTGATGIQTITEVAKTAGHLTVFQRNANWACPMHNAPIDAEEMEQLREWYPEMERICKEDGVMGFLHPPYPVKALDVSDEEREARWEKLYNTRGFAIQLSNFADVNTDRTANELASAFMAKKIRQRVNDPKVAERLTPKNHGFTTRRVPLESGYYEIYNQSNVTLVDLQETPIKEITEKGITTSDEEFQFDMIIYATGFDAITGSYERIDFQGLNGKSLKDMWGNGPKTYLGLGVPNFPNMLMQMGPHQALGNYPRSLEFAAEWITTAMKNFEDHGITYVEATENGTEEWYQHVLDCAEGSLMNEIGSWMTGVNDNIGKTTPHVVRYTGSNQGFKEACNAVSDKGYTTFRLA